MYLIRREGWKFFSKKNKRPCTTIILVFYTYIKKKAYIHIAQNLKSPTCNVSMHIGNFFYTFLLFHALSSSTHYAADWNYVECVVELGKIIKFKYHKIVGKSGKHLLIFIIMSQNVHSAAQCCPIVDYIFFVLSFFCCCHVIIF